MGTKLSDVLATVQGQCPADDTRKCAIVFRALDRTLDHLIQSALSLDEYHRGLPSPWSHVILLADKYTGGATPTVECTVRDKKNRIIWDQDHANLINILSGHN